MAIVPLPIGHFVIDSLKMTLDTSDQNRERKLQHGPMTLIDV